MNLQLLGNMKGAVTVGLSGAAPPLTSSSQNRVGVGFLIRVSLNSSRGFM